MKYSNNLKFINRYGSSHWTGGFILLKENSPAEWIHASCVVENIKKAIKENLRREWSSSYHTYNIFEHGIKHILFDYAYFTECWRAIYSLQGDKLFNYDEGERKFCEFRKCSYYDDGFWKEFYDEYLNPLIGEYHEFLKMFIDDDYVEEFKRALEMVKIDWLKNLNGEVVYFYDTIHENKPNSVLLQGTMDLSNRTLRQESVDSPDSAFIYNPFAKYFTYWNFDYYYDVLRDFFNIVFNCELEQGPLCIMEDGKARYAITNDKIIEKQPDCKKKLIKKLSAYGINRGDIISRLVD